MAHELSYLQFLVLAVLMGSEQSGRNVREELVKQGKRKLSLAGFYQLMARLEEAKLIEGRYEQKMIDGVAIKERHYKVLASGVRTWEATRRSYEQATRIGRLRLA